MEFTPAVQKKQNKKQQTISINTTLARSELKLLKSLVQQNNWKEVLMEGGKAHFLWRGLQTKEEDLEFYKSYRVNRFPGMSELCSKVLSAYYLNKFQQYLPEEFDFYPPSYSLPQQSEQFRQAVEKHKNKVYILKPDTGCQGDGISIINKIDDLRNLNWSKEYVAQEYIHPPLLLDQKKFDLRIYVLISRLQPFTVYINRLGLARFCTENYQKPDNTNMRKPYIHLTNYSLNKENVNAFVVPEDATINEINQASKRNLISIRKSIQKEYPDLAWDSIWEHMKAIITKSLISMKPFLDFNHKCAFNNWPKRPKCFQILGFDILLDKNGTPYLLEINANPSLNIEHEYYDSQEKKYVKKDSLLDYQIKRKVVEEAILIVKNQKINLEKEDVAEYLDTYEPLITGDVESVVKNSDFLQKLLQICGVLSGFRFKETITSSQFTKLASYQGMTNDKFIKYDYELLFISTMRNQNSKQMSFPSFIDAFEVICDRLVGEGEKLDRILLITDRVISQLN